MTITLNLAPIAGFAATNPWATIGIVLVVGVVLPGVWSRHAWRRRAAVALTQAIGQAVTAIASASRRARRP